MQTCTKTCNLPKWELQKALLLTEENNRGKLFLNPITNIEVLVWTNAEGCAKCKSFAPQKAQTQTRAVTKYDLIPLPAL